MIKKIVAPLKSMLYDKWAARPLSNMSSAFTERDQGSFSARKG